MSHKTHAPADYATDKHIDKRTRAFLETLNGAGGPPLETLPTEAMRQVLEGAQSAVAVDVSGIEESEKVIVQDNFTVSINIVKPQGTTGILPVFLFIHGGGWILGDYATHKRLVRDLVVLSGKAAVFVNYTRTPEAAFPTAIDEIFAAAKWVAAHGAEIGVDGKNMAIVGNSVGGNMAAVTAIRAVETGAFALQLQVLLWPVTDHNFDTKSYRKYGQDRFLTAPLMQFMFDLYAPESERDNIYISPLRAGKELLKGLPPTLIQVAENDILRDEGEHYGRKLDDAGVTVTTIRYMGAIHDFGLLNGLADVPATRSMLQHAAAALRQYLG